jgi:hypothetical protein
VKPLYVAGGAAVLALAYLGYRRWQQGKSPAAQLGAALVAKPAEVVAPKPVRLPTPEQVRPPPSPPVVASALNEVLPMPPIPPTSFVAPPPVMLTAQVGTKQVLREPAAPPPQVFVPPPVEPKVSTAPPLPVFVPPPVAAAKAVSNIFGAGKGVSFEWLGGAGVSDY